MIFVACPSRSHTSSHHHRSHHNYARAREEEEQQAKSRKQKIIAEEDEESVSKSRREYLNEQNLLMREKSRTELNPVWKNLGLTEHPYAELYRVIRVLNETKRDCLTYKG